MKTIKTWLMLLICIAMLSCKKESPKEEAGFTELDLSMIQWGPSWIPFDTNFFPIDTNTTTYCFRGKGRISK